MMVKFFFLRGSQSHLPCVVISEQGKKRRRTSMQIQELITKDHHFLQQFVEICIQFETAEQRVYHDIFASSNVLSRLLTFWFFMSGNAL